MGGAGVSCGRVLFCASNCAKELSRVVKQRNVAVADLWLGFLVCNNLVACHRLCVSLLSLKCQVQRNNGKRGDIQGCEGRSVKCQHKKSSGKRGLYTVQGHNR